MLWTHTPKNHVHKGDLSALKEALYNMYRVLSNLLRSNLLNFIQFIPCNSRKFEAPRHFKVTRKESMSS